MRKAKENKIDEIILEYSIAKLSLHDNEEENTIIALKDITEKVINENKISDSEKRYKALVQHGADLTAVLDTIGNYTFISPNHLNILGYTEKDLIGYNGFDFIHPDDLPLIQSEFQQILASGRIQSSPYRFKKKDNTWCWVQSTGTNLLNDPAVGGIVINSLEVSNLINTQQTLQRSNERFELLNKITKDIIYEWDVVQDEFHWGESFSRIFGYEITNKKFRNHDLSEIMHPVDSERTKDSWFCYLNNPNQNQWTNEFRLRRKDGSYAYVEESSIIIRDEAGAPLKMIGVIRDTSEKKIIEIQKTAQNQFSILFSQNKKLEELLKDALLFLITYGEFLGAELWLLDNQNNVLKQVCAESKPENKNHIFNKKIKIYKKGDGLPGRVWESGEIENRVEKTNLDNNPSQYTQNNITALGLPITHNSNFEGVLVVYANENIAKDFTKTDPLLNLGNLLNTEIKRKHQEEMHFLMFQSAPDIIATVNQEGYFTKVNPAFCKLLGYTEKEITSQPFSNFIHQEDLITTKKEYKKTISGFRNALNFVNRYRTKNGDYKWISWSSSDPFGDEKLAFAYGRHITDIIELQKLFSETAKLAEIGSWEFSFEKKEQHIYLSNVIKDLFDLDREDEVTFDEFIQFFHNEDKAKINNLIQKLIHSGNKFDTEFQIKTKDGNLKWIRCIAQSEMNPKKECKKIFGSIQNIEKQKNNELDLAKKNNYLAAITQINTELLQTEDWKQSINNILETTAKIMNADGVQFLEIHENKKRNKIQYIQKFEWLKNEKKISKKSPTLKEINPETSIYKTLQRGVTYFGSNAELLNGKATTKKLKSVIILPIMINNALYGGIVFIDNNLERKWNISETSFLFNIAVNLTTKIQRTNSKKELENSLNERNNILESIGDAFFTVDNNWIITYWNKESERVTGYNRNYVIGKNFWEACAKLIGKKYQEKRFQNMKKDKNIAFQDYFEDLNAWLDINIYPSDSGLSVYFKDITKTKKYEEEIIASNERFEKSTSATNDAIWDWNIEINLLYRGRGFRKLFGHEIPRKTYNSNVLQLIESSMHPEDATDVVASLKKAIANSEIKNWEAEYRYNRADGTYAYVVNRCVLIRDKFGIATRIVGAIQDITERKKQEESLKLLNKKLEAQTKELISSNEELEQFANIASHDLQEPLRMITSFLTQLEKKYYNKLDDKGKQYIQFAVDGALRMRNIILDILEYSKIGKDADIEMESIDINTIINDIWKINNKTVEKTKAKIQYQDLPVIHSFKTPIMQIFHNLIGNALKYKTPQTKPIIKVVAHDKESHWLFSVEDNGIGIQKEFQQKIFEIFQRLHTKNEFSGTGIGLAIVKKQIENLGGTIWVDSEFGKGSTFYFTLPKK